MFRVEYFLSFVLRVCVCLFVWLHLLFSHCPCSYIFLTNFSFFLSFFQLTDSHSLIYSPFVYAFLFNFPHSPPSLILLYLMSLCVCVCNFTNIPFHSFPRIFFLSFSLYLTSSFNRSFERFFSALHFLPPPSSPSPPSIDLSLSLLPCLPPFPFHLPLVLLRPSSDIDHAWYINSRRLQFRLSTLGSEIDGREKLDEGEGRREVRE